jgi:hypothetical protein
MFYSSAQEYKKRLDAQGYLRHQTKEQGRLWKTKGPTAGSLSRTAAKLSRHFPERFFPEAFTRAMQHRPYMPECKSKII